VDGRRVRIGNADFCAELAGSPAPAGEARSSACLADESGWLARFEFEDPLRADAADLVNGLRAAGLTVHLLSGDDPRVVEALARTLGITAVAGGATPQDKFAYVERLQGEGRIVAMLGDGVNDAPVLARADVSIAMGQGAEVAQLQSDFVLLSERLGALAEASELARRTQGVIRQNLAWALAYNALALPLAVAGMVGPWEAAIGMAASSFIVVLNALRVAAQKGASWNRASTSWSPSRSRSYS
jgi:Cu2+-exporting ATPase